MKVGLEISGGGIWVHRRWRGWDGIYGVTLKLLINDDEYCSCILIYRRKQQQLRWHSLLLRHFSIKGVVLTLHMNGNLVSYALSSSCKHISCAAHRSNNGHHAIIVAMNRLSQERLSTVFVPNSISLSFKARSILDLQNGFPCWRKCDVSRLKLSQFTIVG